MGQRIFVLIVTAKLPGKSCKTCSESTSISIGSSTIARDQLDAGMPLKPGRKGVHRGVFQHIDRGMALEIDQHSAVALAFAPCPFIHPQHFYRQGRGQSSMTNQSQNGIGTTRHPQSLAHLGCRFATNDLTERSQALSQARCALSREATGGSAKVQRRSYESKAYSHSENGARVRPARRTARWKVSPAASACSNYARVMTAADSRDNTRLEK
jgi:hypothetical protein